jgi:hypothetical protein
MFVLFGLSSNRWTADGPALIAAAKIIECKRLRGHSTEARI